MMLKLLAVGIFPLVALYCNVLRWSEIRKAASIQSRRPFDYERFKLHLENFRGCRARDCAVAVETNLPDER
jgi:hypothetical protein